MEIIKPRAVEVIEVPKAKHPGGRPKRLLSSLPENWKQIIFEMMEDGASLEEVTVKLDISPPLFYRLVDDEPEFSDTIKRGKLLSKAWWLGVGRTNLKDKNFSYVGWYMNMKNRFGWVDRQETNINIQIPTSITIPKEGKLIRLLPPAEAKNELE